MEKEERKKLFIRFLKENNCYKQYVRNYDNNFNLDSGFIYNCLNELYDDRLPNEDNEFTDAFSWGNTYEGFEYWDDMDDKWRSFVMINNL